MKTVVHAVRNYMHMLRIQTGILISNLWISFSKPSRHKVHFIMQELNTSNKINFVFLRIFRRINLLFRVILLLLENAGGGLAFWGMWTHWSNCRQKCGFQNRRRPCIRIKGNHSACWETRRCKSDSGCHKTSTLLYP